MAALEWHARSDGNHWPLAERLRTSLDGTTLFDARVARVDDLNGLPGRAAGGKPVQRFKLQELARIASEASTPFVWSDVDVQPLGSLQRLHDALRDVTGTEGGADCDRWWGMHFVFRCCASAMVSAESRTGRVTRAHGSSCVP